MRAHDALDEISTTSKVRKGLNTSMPAASYAGHITLMDSLSTSTLDLVVGVDGSRIGYDEIVLASIRATLAGG